MRARRYIRHVYVQVLAGWPTDVTLSLVELQRFVNRVGGYIRRRLPGVLLSASLKLRVNSRWNTRQGIRGIGEWYEDDLLLAAGNDPDGMMDLRQYQ